MNFTKADLISFADANCGPDVSDRIAKEVVDAALEAIVEAVRRGQTVNLRNFGTFKTVDCAERQGRNPQTGEPITIPAHKRAVCKLTFGVE